MEDKSCTLDHIDAHPEAYQSETPFTSWFWGRDVDVFIDFVDQNVTWTKLTNSLYDLAPILVKSWKPSDMNTERQAM